MIIFKLIFALLSAQIGKFFGLHPGVGLLVGGFFGHFLDMLAHKKFLIWKYKKFHTQKMKAQSEADFLFCFFTLAGKVCSADNKYTFEEENKINEIMLERFKYKRKNRNLAKKYFQQAPNQNIAIQSLASKLAELMGSNQQQLENAVYLLKEIAECDGKLNQQEFRVIFTAASVWGMDPDESNRILKYTTTKQQNTSNQNKDNNSAQKQNLDPLHAQYQILGCNPKDSADKIKRSYRELVAKYHPDKIISKELPQDFIDFAANKFKEVQMAYESVKKARGF